MTLQVSGNEVQTQRGSELARPVFAALMVGLGLAATQPALAEPTEATRMQVAFVVGAYDRYLAQCKSGNGPNEDQARRFHQWEQDNDLDGLRRRLAASPLPPGRQRELKAGLDKLQADIDGQSRQGRVDPCVAGLALVRTPEARIGGLLAEPAGQGTALSAPPAAAMGQGAGPDTRQLAAQMDSFGFHTRPKMGLGGFITLDIYPIVLFKGGDALTRVKRLSEGGDLASLRQRYPEDFTQWRRSGGELQIRGKEGWKKLAFQNTFARLPDGLRLDGLYRATGGTGNVALGGSQSVTVWNEYRFTADGQVYRGGGAGGRAEAGDASVVTSTPGRGRSGRYRIDGLTLWITYGDGSEERRILIADPQDKKGALWIDGEGYVRRDR